MSFPLLPFFLGGNKDEVIRTYSITGKLLFPYSSLDISKYLLHKFPSYVDLYVDVSKEELGLDEIVKVLNVGIQKIFISESQYEEVVTLGGLPSSRFAIKFRSSKVEKPMLESAAAFIFGVELSEEERVLYSQDGNRELYLEKDFGKISQDEAEKSAQRSIMPIISTSELTCHSEEKGKVSLSKVFTSTLVTDRHDGLFTTLVTSPPPFKEALGIVYSSVGSIQASINEQVGVYQSRKRRQELWYKGKTSGATQKLLKIEKDCDSDVVKFTVDQRDGFGFCHLRNNFTCFKDSQLKGDDKTYGNGLAKLDYTLFKRSQSAPEGSYTRRLFQDESLLVSKLKEELDELIEAGQNLEKDTNEVSWECADLFYFALVWCIKHNVRLSDIERNLDIKSGRITRRKGDAKPEYVRKDLSETKGDSQRRMNVVDVRDSSTTPEVVASALARPHRGTSDIMKLVLPIISKVQQEGDKGLLELTTKLDGVTLDTPVLNAPFPEEMMKISEDVKKAIDLSMDNIEKFHSAQLPKEDVMTVETSPGVFCSRFAKPIESIGLYVPGGTAILPSTAMMLGVPAKVAGCPNLVLASPPSRATGKITPEVVYVAHKLGAKSILMAGGAQAVAALAYGTDSVIKCDKILGPGNQFVTAAKMHVQNDTKALCSIDMPAGPSEVLVIADEGADPDYVAADLLSQAEHGIDSQVILIGINLSSGRLDQIQASLRKQTSALPRKDIVSECLSHSTIFLVDSYEQAFKLSNRYAPEHLILQIRDAASYVPNSIQNAGSVFVGSLACESCGDYSSGTNHTLPTYGYAKQYSGVNTSTYQTFITSQEVTKEGMKNIGNAVMSLAHIEGLQAHENAVRIRMEKLGLI